MVPKLLLCTFAAFTLLSGMINAARILALVADVYRSHQIWIGTLILELAERGHQITVLIPEPSIEPHPNIKLMLMEGSFEKYLEKVSLEDLVNHSPVDSAIKLGTWSSYICEHQLATKAAKDLMDMPPDSFDLILVEVGSHCMYLYLHHFGGGTRGSLEKCSEKVSFEELVNHSPVGSGIKLGMCSSYICEHQLATKAAKDLMDMAPDSFDLILMEVGTQSCMYLYLHHFGGGTRIPAVGFSSLVSGFTTDMATGVISLPSVKPFANHPYLSKMNFWERMHNTLLSTSTWLVISFQAMPIHRKTAENAYGRRLPSFSAIAANISLILVNSHFALDGAQPHLPGVIEVGAMQCSPSKPLPKDIQSFLDGAEEGAIFFSLGSILQSELLPKEKLSVIIDTFAALGPKIRVLWKFNPKVPIKGLPSNVLLKKWFPQEDVLGHPKILAFVSHAGLLSTHEAIYHGIPLVTVPFFGDQHGNARRMAEMKVAVHVHFVSITKESFTEKILTVINNSSYRTNMRRLSSLIRDQPQTPLERAIFWVEFTLRHGKGRVEALRFIGLDLDWYQYFLLDVFGLICLIIFVTAMVAVLVMHGLYKYFMKAFNSVNSIVKSKKME